MNDIRIKELEDELHKVKEEYKNFAYIVSHDFSAPFRQIQGFANLIINDSSSQFNDKTKEYFDLIISSSENCQNLIRGLLEFSRTNNISKENYEQLDLNEVFDEVMLEMEDVIESEKAVINLKKLPVVSGERTYIKKLFSNLLDNAIKFHKQEQSPAIDVYLVKDDDFDAEIVIKDNGIGINDKFRTKIFEPFRKGNAGKNYKGSGIGLTVAKRIAELHEGDLSLENSSEDGTIFKIRLQK